VSVSISKEVRKGDGREVGKNGGWERGGKVEGDDGGGGRGGGERGTRDEVIIWSGHERLNFMGQLWRRYRRREQSRAEQSRAGEGRGDKTRGTGNGNGKMEKWQKGKGEDGSDDKEYGGVV